MWREAGVLVRIGATDANLLPINTNQKNGAAGLAIVRHAGYAHVAWRLRQVAVGKIVRDRSYNLLFIKE
jgi:hypothetical protein